MFFNASLFRCGLLSLVVACAGVSLQAQSWITEVVRGADGQDRAYNLVNTQIQEALSIGLTSSYGDPTTFPNAHVVLSDALLGAKNEWVYNVQVAEFEMSIYECENSDYIWTTGVRGFSSNVDVLVVRTDISGNVLWARVIGQENNDADYSTSIIEASTQEIYVTGVTDDPAGFGNTDAFVINPDGGSGNVNWSQFYGGDYFDSGRCIRELPSGDFVVVGQTELDLGGVFDMQAWAFSIDAGGALLWSEHYGDKSTIDGFSTCVYFEPNEQMYATGVYNDGSTFASYIYVVAFDWTTGVQLVADAYAVGTPGQAGGWFINRSVDNERLVVTGQAGEVNNSGNLDAFFMLLDPPLGIPIIYRHYGALNRLDMTRAITPTLGQPGVTDVGYYMAGWTPHSSTTDDHWLLRTNLLGKTGCDDILNPDPVRIERFEEQHTDQTDYYQGKEIGLEYEEPIEWQEICPGMYVPPNALKTGSHVNDTRVAMPQFNIAPNPVSGGQAARIEFNAEEELSVLLTVSNVQGREVLRAAYTIRSGQSAISLPTQNWTGGVYNVRIQAGQQTGTAAFVIVE